MTLFQISNSPNPQPKRRAFCYQLCNGEGGTFITSATTLLAARAELSATYGDRLTACVSAFKSSASRLEDDHDRNHK